VSERPCLLCGYTTIGNYIAVVERDRRKPWNTGAVTGHVCITHTLEQLLAAGVGITLSQEIRPAP
jgi:hypothetical protein